MRTFIFFALLFSVLGLPVWAADIEELPEKSEPSDAEKLHKLEDKKPQDERLFRLGAYVGANVLSSYWGSGGASTGFIGFNGGLDGQIYFVPKVGFLTGLQFNTRGFDTVGNQSASAWFLDIPFGFVFRYQAAMFGGDAINVFSLGGYYSIPLADFYRISATTNSNGTNDSFGLYIFAKTVFPISPDFALGFGSWVRFGLTGAILTTSADKLLEVGFGLVADF